MPEPRKYSEAQKKSAKKWDAANLDRISVAAPKGTKERWKAAATAQEKSLNQLIVESVDHQISQDRDKGPSEAVQGPLGAGVVSIHAEAIQTAQEAAQKAGETVSQFIERAIAGEVERNIEDERAERGAIELCLRALRRGGLPEKNRKMLEESLIARGIDPATGEKLEGDG